MIEGCGLERCTKIEEVLVQFCKEFYKTITHFKKNIFKNGKSRHNMGKRLNDVAVLNKNEMSRKLSKLEVFKKNYNADNFIS